MIGNDIIDLKLAWEESHWQRTGFLDKIMTAKEQNLIFNASEAATMVWYLWSLKEAAYKIYNRVTKIRAFIPLQLECFDVEFRESFHYAKVVCNGHVYWSKTIITTDCIDTVVVTKSSDFSRVVTLESNTIIHKKNGIPFYVVDTALQPLSKSHHGRFERIVTLL